MWTYCAYILYRYLNEVLGGSDTVTFDEFAYFMLYILRVEHGFHLYGSRRELWGDLLYLRELGVLDLDPVDKPEHAVIRVPDMRKLEEIYKTVERSHVIIGGLYRIYKERIDRAIRSAIKGRQVRSLKSSCGSITFTVT